MEAEDSPSRPLPVCINDGADLEALRQKPSVGISFHFHLASFYSQKKPHGRVLGPIFQEERERDQEGL